MTSRNNIGIYIALIVLWAALLVLQYFVRSAFPDSISVLVVNSFVPIPLTVLVMVFVVGRFLENREVKTRKQQLMFLKSCMYRLDMRELHIANFSALGNPSITFAEIGQASLSRLKRMREDAEVIEYKSPEAMEPVIIEFVKAMEVWRSFLNMALENRFESIMQDMLSIKHFVGDVMIFKELNPGKLYIEVAARDEAAMERVNRILGGSIRKFLDYAIELKEKEPELFDQVLRDYELLARRRA